MLRELPEVHQIPGQRRRRWFADAELDLVVWLDAQGLPCGFQLCYDKGAEEHAVSWKQGVGITHNRVDDGERTGERRKLTPVLVPDGVLPAEALAARFQQASRDLDADISELVLGELLRWAEGRQ